MPGKHVLEFGNSRIENSLACLKFICWITACKFSKSFGGLFSSLDNSLRFICAVSITAKYTCCPGNSLSAFSHEAEPRSDYSTGPGI